jgi:phospholipase/carboxylesterase
MKNNILLERKHARPVTFNGMPHAQIDVEPLPEIHTELFNLCFSLPNVSNRPTVISIPGARALWLDDDILLAHPEYIARGREFAHIHPDGSLHASLSPERAREAVEKGWAEPHPIAQYTGWEGMVMLYTPLDMDELDVIFELVVDSYNFITGRNLFAKDVMNSAYQQEKHE